MDDSARQFLINEVKCALAIQHNEYSSNDDRLRAFQFCEEAKEKMDWATCFFLMHSQNSSSERHFGEQVLLHIVKTKWQILNTQKQKVRDIVIEFIKLGTKEVTGEDLFIKEKIAEVFVEIAKRSWPDQWPSANLKKDLHSILKCGDQQAEIVLMILEGLAIDIFEYTDAIPKRRRTLLLEELKTLMSGFYRIAYRSLSANYPKFMNDRSAHYFTLLKVGLNTILAYFIWIPISKLSDQPYWELCGTLIKEPSLRVKTAECLLEILNKDFKKPGFAVYRDHVLTPVYSILPILFEALSVTTPDFEENYLFQKTLIKILATLGSKHLMNFDQNLIPPNYESYIKMMLDLTCHPSPTVLSSVLSFWVIYFQHLPSEQLEFSKTLIVPLLTNLDGKAIDIWGATKNISQPLLSPSEIDIVKYCEFEFSIPHDCMMFYRTIDVQLSDLVRKLSHHHLEMMFDYLQNRVTNVIKEVSIPSDIKLKEQSKKIQLFNILKIELNAILGSIQDYSHPFIIQEIERNLKTLFEYDPQEPLLIVSKLSTLTSFSKYYETNSTSLEVVLTAVINFLSYTQANETINNLSKETIFIRKSACNIFFEFSNLLSAQLCQQLPVLLNIIGNLFESKKLLLHEEYKILKALVSLSNGLMNYTDKANFYESILNSHVTEWSSPDMTNILSSVQNFSDFIGVDADIRKSADICKRSEKFINILCSFYNVWSTSQLPNVKNKDCALESLGFGARTHEVHLQNQVIPMTFDIAYPHTPLSIRIIGNICLCIKVIHQLWSPPCKSLVPDRYKIIYESSDSVRDQSLITSMEMFYTKEVDPVLVKNLIERSRSFCYFIIGKIIAEEEGFFTRPNLVDNLNSIFMHLQYLDIPDQIHFINQVLNPLIEHTKEAFYPIVLPIIYDAYIVIFRNLIASWQDYLVLKEKQDSVKEINRALQKENVVTTLAKLYPWSLQTLLLTKTKKSGKMVLKPSPQLIYMLQAGVLHELVFSLVNLVFIDNPVSSERAALMLCSIVPSIIDEEIDIPKNVLDSYIDLFVDLFSKIVNGVISGDLTIQKTYGDSTFRLFSTIIISILDRGQQTEIQKIFSCLPNITNEILQKFEENYRNENLISPHKGKGKSKMKSPTSPNSPNKNKKSRKYVIIWDLLEKTGVVKVEENRTNISDVAPDHVFVKAQITMEEDDNGISFDQIADLFGAL